MAKKGGTRSATYDKKKSGRSEVWTVRASDGVYKTARTSRSSTASIDKAAKRYAGALKRLAKR
jgi:hypothetical protein